MRPRRLFLDRLKTTGQFFWSQCHVHPSPGMCAVSATVDTAPHKLLRPYTLLFISCFTPFHIRNPLLIQHNPCALPKHHSGHCTHSQGAAKPS